MIAAIICAAGASSRMGGIKKEYRAFGSGVDGEGKPLSVLGAVVAAFAASPRIDTIVITVPLGAENGEAAARACLPARFLRVANSGGESPSQMPAGDLQFCPQSSSLLQSSLASNSPPCLSPPPCPPQNPPRCASPALLFVPGGKSRRISVHHALSLLSAYRPDYVLIHDGARPWVDTGLIERVIDAVMDYKAVAPVTPLVETPKEIAWETAETAAGAAFRQGFVKRHLRRANVGAAQTPQAFEFRGILAAHEKAAERELREGIEYTDDAEVWGEFCGPVAVVQGSPANRKITFPEDLE